MTEEKLATKDAADPHCPIKWLIVVTLLAGCSEVGSVVITPTGCRLRGWEGVTMTQQVEGRTVRCIIEYKGKS